MPRRLNFNPVDQNRNARLDGLAAADRSDSLTALRLHADRLDRQLKQCGKVETHLLFGGTEARPLEVHRAVYVYGQPAAAAQLGGRGKDELAGISTAIGGLGVRKPRADVAQAQAAQQRVGQRVQQHVAVGVGNNAEVCLDDHSANAQGPAAAACQGVTIGSNADPTLRRGTHSLVTYNRASCEDWLNFADPYAQRLYRAPLGVTTSSGG
jgi:hypothetical protein